MAEFRDTYRDFILPLLAVAETIGTKGASPGTSAMNQQRIMYDSEDRKKAQAEKEKQEAEKARKAAMEEKLYGYQIGDYERKKTESEKAQEEALRKRAEQELYGKSLEGLSTDEEKRKAVLDYLAKNDPKAYASETRPKDPNSIEELLKLQLLRGQFDLQKGQQEIQKSQIKQTQSPRLSQETVKNLTELSNFPNLLGDLKTAIREKGDVMGPVKGRLYTVAGELGSTNENVLRAQDLNAAYEATKQVVAKAMEGGVLRKEDMPKYQKILGDIQKTPQAAGQNIARLEKMLGRDYNNYLKNLQGQGYDIGSFEPIKVAEAPKSEYHFKTVQEAEAANLPPGTEIYIAGRKAVIE